MFFLFLLIPAALFGAYIYHWLLRLLPALRRRKNTWKARLLLLPPAAALAALTVDLPTVLSLFLLHFWFFSALAEAAGWVLKKLLRRYRPFPGAVRYVYRLSLVPLAIAAAMMLYGGYNMAHVTGTHYTLETAKDVPAYRIAFLSDTHYGTIQDPSVLRTAAAEIDAAHPDVVILGGDVVEDGTSFEDMEEVFALLGGLSSRYGTYYIYGNHDRQSYSRDRSYSGEQLAAAIQGNGIRILEDERVPIGGGLVLVGRADAGWDGGGRPPVAALLEDGDQDRLILVADHQPKDLEENGLAGADVQLSGHTHAGQVFPVDLIEGWMGILVYGRYEAEGCTLFVSSGVTGWGFPIRTCRHCEYVILDVVPGK